MGGGRRTGDRVVIVGAGVTGALSAVRLAERGFRVTVLEKAGIAHGASSRSMAGIRAQFGVTETITGMMYAEWWYTGMHEHLATPPDRRQPAIRQNGYLFLFEHAEAAAPAWEPAARAAAEAAWTGAQANVERQRALGLPVERLAPAEIAARWPHLDAERLIGATWCPTDGFLFPPVIYGEGFRRARELGVELVLGAEVIGARCRGDRLLSLETARGEVEADWFVNAANAWAPRLGRCIGAAPLPIRPLKRYLYFLRPDAYPLPFEAWERLPMTIYGMGPNRRAHSRPDGASLIIAGSHDALPEPAFADEDQDRIEPAFDHRNGVENYGYRLLREVDLFAPSLANAGGLVATTSGYYDMSPDGSPLIGFDANHANLLHAVGFSGHGLMHAPITARLVEALLAGDARDGRVALPAPFARHSIDLSAFDPYRDFSRSEQESHVL